MTDSDSDSFDSSRLVRLNSGPPEYDAAPREVEFKLKITNERGEKTRCFYVLKEGSVLPYKPTIPGLTIQRRNYF